MKREWFEMAKIRKRRFDDAVWIPLRASHKTEAGKSGHLGYRSEFFGVGSLAVPLERRDEAAKLGWMDLGLAHDHCGYCGYEEPHSYVASDEQEDESLKGAIPLVLAQGGNSVDRPTWHIHQDFVITLGLKREGNLWVAMDEDYIEVARMEVDEDDRPNLLEVRADHLKDYLCARGMALLVSCYREREEVMETEPGFEWPKPDGAYKDGERWEGRIQQIHEGGYEFGSSMAVTYVTRPNLDLDEDVPKVGISDEFATSTVTRKLAGGRKLYRVLGEVWRDEWVEPGTRSTRIRRDEPASPISFIVGAGGQKETAKRLIDSGRWLWFKPDLVPALVERRGGGLRWYTRETGGVRGWPHTYIHFGINSLGLVNAYAKDVAHLPEWLQRVWAGFNVSPDGKVSEELFSAQAQGVPADTQAPEAFLADGVEILNDAFAKRFGVALFRPYTDPQGIFAPCHRFKALSESGLYGLAKELVRGVLEHIDVTPLHKIVSPPPGEKWGSLKSLEKVLASITHERWSRGTLGPLHGIYNLRLADAHLPREDLDEAFALARVDKTLPFVMQGRDLLVVCVASLHVIADALKSPGD
ncbi:MAG: hypothetical protein ACRD8A_06995 [Candidatus Acidiferrales bacterium]